MHLTKTALRVSFEIIPFFMSLGFCHKVYIVDVELAVLHALNKDRLLCQCEIVLFSMSLGFAKGVHCKCRTSFFLILSFKPFFNTH